MNKIKWVPIIIFVILLSSLACNLPFFRQATPEPLTSTGGDELSSNGESEQDSSQSPGVEETILLEITEDQLTNLVAQELEGRVGDQVNNLQVFLREGQIQIFGDVDSQGISAPVKVVLEASLDPVGRPNIKVVSSNIGPFPLPAELISEVEVMMNRAFQEKIQDLAPNASLELIVIEGGRMTIYGSIK
ncbi:MAG: hypothetical protein JSV42_14775 [Chloroflexota bacterium]|nr:MAG: hypothetical protein JSV42_14775 [Chloroflexota bacterium]